MIGIHDTAARFATASIAFVAVWIGSASVFTHAQETKSYKLRFDPSFEIGDRWRLTRTASQEVYRTEKPAEGKATTQEFKNRVVFEGVCTAKGISKTGESSEMIVDVEKCELHSDGQEIEILKAKERVLVGTKDGERTYKLADGGAIFAEKRRLLAIAIAGSEVDGVPLVELFSLSEPRQVGDTWRCETGKLLKAFNGLSKDLVAQDVRGSAEFTAVEKQDGKTTLKWSASMKAETKNPPVPPTGGVPVFGSFEWKSEQNIPATRDEGKWRKTTTAEMKQIFKGKPGSEQENTTFDGASIQVYETTIEFLEASK